MRKLILAGFIGNDATVNDLPSGNMQVINFNIATTDKFKEETRTTWVRCSRFTNNVAISPYLKKGTYVIVTGRAEVETYTDQNQQTHAVLKCIVDEIEFGGAKTESSDGGNAQPQAQAPQPQTPTPSSDATANIPNVSNNGEEHDDLPF
jgi:single-strand DNA-binding protein